ncbi:glycosyltransferase family 2 protein [Chryseobacterium gambrini]|uniref:glycosyltransferase family 2 protein n=1 Tax=Chryseobacterium gambrini TaxID=373672 RepID=UPI0022F15C5C|nr:glycosyltransferase family A protein [Chryseobacterium gambrini]WBV51580.1 glycosyltransferase family A protein [Chryseobacterium gambrini]
MSPKISIIVPCYNQAQYLDECLQSVFDQTYPDWECIIVNDGSPDSTEEAARKWIEKDARFQYIYKKNGGLSSARNAGVEVAKGKWILPLDADDKISNRYLELAEKQFDSTYKIIYCEAEKFGTETGKWILENFSTKALAVENVIFCSAFFKKEDWVKVNGYDTNLIYGWEDWEFWISILKNGGQVYKIPEICFYYRIKEVSMIQEMKSTDSTFKVMSSKNLIYKKHIEFFTKELGSFQTLYRNNQKIIAENNNLKKILASKRYVLINKFFNFFKL